MALVAQQVGGIPDMQVDWDILKGHPAVMEYICRIGLKNILQDSHAAMTEKQEADEAARVAKKTAMAEKKLTALYAGEVSQQRASGDPVAKEMRAMAESDLRTKLKALGKKVSDFEAKVWSAVVQKQIDANAAEYRAKAEAKLAIKPEVSIEGADLLALIESVTAEATPEEPAESGEEETNSEE